MGVIVVISANGARLPYAAGFLMPPRSERAVIWIHASVATANALILRPPLSL